MTVYVKLSNEKASSVCARVMSGGELCGSTVDSSGQVIAFQ